MKQTYTHSSDKVCRPLRKSKAFGNGNGDEIRDQGLHDKDDGNHCQLQQLVSAQLGSQFGENCAQLAFPLLPEAEEHLTQTWRKEGNVQVGQELLFVGIEHALPGDNISRQTDTDNLHHGLEYQEDQMAQGRMCVVIIARAQKGKGREGVGWDGRAIFVASNKRIESVGGGSGEETHAGGSGGGCARV